MALHPHNARNCRDIIYLAIVDIDGGKAAIKILARSSSETMKEDLSTSLESCFNMAGMKVEFSGAYGGWDPNTDSELIKVMRNIYKNLFNEEPTVQVVHAGLECSIICLNIQVSTSARSVRHCCHPTLRQSVLTGRQQPSSGICS